MSFCNTAAKKATYCHSSPTLRANERAMKQNLQIIFLVWRFCRES
jgi:hypothetical protein